MILEKLGADEYSWVIGIMENFLLGTWVIGKSPNKNQYKIWDRFHETGDSNLDFFDKPGETSFRYYTDIWNIISKSIK